MTNHTPPPWQVVDKIVLYLGDCHLGPQIWGEKRIGFIETQNVGTETARANAEFIVRAVNSHGALVAVAEMALLWLSDDHVARYEEVAEEFYRDTHMMAPGKSQPLEAHDGISDEERRARWDEWYVARRARQRAQIEDALAHARGAE